MKTFTKKSAIAIVISASLISAPSFASTVDKEEQRKNENIGFGTGLVVGAILGGPIGAIVSGIAGSMVAKHVNEVNENEVLNSELARVNQAREEQLLAFQQKLKESEQAYQQELISLQQSYLSKTQMQADNLLMSLQFSTGSSEIKPHYQEQIVALANMLKLSPDVTINLSGYTDKQGSDELNQALSLARVNSVKKALIDQGVVDENIRIFAHGENDPVVANNQNEVSFYDRRVVIKLEQQNSAVAKNF